MAPLQTRRHPISHRGRWCTVNRGLPYRPNPSPLCAAPWEPPVMSLGASAISVVRRSGALGASAHGTSVPSMPPCLGASVPQHFPGALGALALGVSVLSVPLCFGALGA
ncbi:UNVERIFIED_CONTAM: hypothetical protein FKN15_031146 [Acipenser sinensis]